MTLEDPQEQHSAPCRIDPFELGSHNLTWSIEHAGSSLGLGAQLAVLHDYVSAAFIDRQAGDISAPVTAALSAAGVAAHGGFAVLNADHAVAARRLWGRHCGDAPRLNGRGSNKEGCRQRMLGRVE